MLQQEFLVPKFRPFKEKQCNVVYNIPCATCSWNCIGKTSRSFVTRKKEHTGNVKSCAKGSNIANHAWSRDCCIDFDKASIIDTDNYRILKLWNPATQQPLTKQTITLAHYQDNTAFF